MTLTETEVEYEDRVLTIFEQNRMRELEREVERLTQALDLSRVEVRRMRDAQTGNGSATSGSARRSRAEREELRRRAESAERTAEFSLGRCKVLSRDLRAERREVQRLKRKVRELGGEP